MTQIKKQLFSVCRSIIRSQKSRLPGRQNLVDLVTVTKVMSLAPCLKKCLHAENII